MEVTIAILALERTYLLVSPYDKHTHCVNTVVAVPNTRELYSAGEAQMHSFGVSQYSTSN